MAAIEPFKLLKSAIRAVPAVKYALGIGGVIAIIAIVVAGWKLDPRVAVFGTILMIVLMTLLVIFAKLADAPLGIFVIPILVLTWFSLILMMATATALFSSVFFKWPVDLQGIFPHPNTATQPTGNSPHEVSNDFEPGGTKERKKASGHPVQGDASSIQVQSPATERSSHKSCLVKGSLRYDDGSLVPNASVSAEGVWADVDQNGDFQFSKPIACGLVSFRAFTNNRRTEIANELQTIGVGSRLELTAITKTPRQ